MPNGTKDEDIREVMAEESRRGRRPVDDTRDWKKKRERETLRNLLHIEREEEFLNAIRGLGYADEPEKTALILKAWRALASSRKR